MNKLLPIALAAFVCLPGVVSAQEYGWAEFGGAVIPDLDGRLDITSGTGTTRSDVNLKLSPGFSVNGGLGERLSDWLAVEVQGGFLYHNVDEIDVANSGFRSIDASLLQVPIYFNFVFELPLQSRLTPYAGVGAGAMINWLDIDDQFATGGAEPVSVDGSSTEINFAFQAFAGARLSLGERGAVELTYRFMAAGSPTWSLEEADSSNNVGNLKADDLFVHALTLGFLVEF
jgi:opacity protein-like surface antigen